MEDIYKIIEEKIMNAGYKEELSGCKIYNEICDEIEDKENGTYIIMVKKTEDVFFEYKVDIMTDDFNLLYIDIHEGEKVYHVDFE